MKPFHEVLQELVTAKVQESQGLLTVEAVVETLAKQAGLPTLKLARILSDQTMTIPDTTWSALHKIAPDYDFDAWENARAFAFMQNHPNAKDLHPDVMTYVPTTPDGLHKLFLASYELCMPRNAYAHVSGLSVSSALIFSQQNTLKVRALNVIKIVRAASIIFTARDRGLLPRLKELPEGPTGVTKVHNNLSSVAFDLRVPELGATRAPVELDRLREANRKDSKTYSCANIASRMKVHSSLPGRWLQKRTVKPELLERIRQTFPELFGDAPNASATVRSSQILPPAPKTASIKPDQLATSTPMARDVVNSIVMQAFSGVALSIHQFCALLRVADKTAINKITNDDRMELMGKIADLFSLLGISRQTFNQLFEDSYHA